MPVQTDGQWRIRWFFFYAQGYKNCIPIKKTFQRYKNEKKKGLEYFFKFNRV